MRHSVCVGVFALACVCSLWFPLCVQDLQESEGCQDELALRVQQLKAELVLFKGLMSNVSAVQSRTHHTYSQLCTSAVMIDLSAPQWMDCCIQLFQ